MFEKIRKYMSRKGGKENRKERKYKNIEYLTLRREISSHKEKKAQGKTTIQSKQPRYKPEWRTLTTPGTSRLL